MLPTNEKISGIMENDGDPIESLFERAADYTKVSYELMSLKVLEKVSGVASTLVSRFFLAAVLFLFVIAINIGVGLWLGEIVGKIYYGFFIEAGFYFLLFVILLLMHKWIKEKVSSSLISQALI